MLIGLLRTLLALGKGSADISGDPFPKRTICIKKDVFPRGGGRERTISEKYLKTLAICLKSQGVDVSKDSYRDGA